MCDEADGRWDVHNEAWVKARKGHKCYGCQEQIAVGQIYHNLETLYDGQWDRWKHCPRCWEIISALWARDPWAAIDLNLDCGETWEDPPPEISALAFAIPSDMQDVAAAQYAARTRSRRKKKDATQAERNPLVATT